MMSGAYMLCQHCGTHGLPTPGVDWIEAFKAFLRMHAECGEPRRPRAS